MNQDLFEAPRIPTSKEKIIKFYKTNKILIFSIVILILISIISFGFYIEIKEKKKLLLADSYIDAKIYLDKGEKEKAKEILKKIIFSNNNTYAALSFFLILNEKLIDDQQELSNLFDYLLKNGKFDQEVENLIIFKKALFQSNFVSGIQLLETLKPIINRESVWKPHALFLLGDYFVYKKEFLKAKEFYIQILSLKNLHKDFYDEATSQLAFIANE